MIFALAVFLSFFLIFAYAYRKSMRMSENDLRQRMRGAEAQVVLYARAPLAWLSVGTFGALAAISIFALDYTDSLWLIVVATALFVAWVLSAALAVRASYFGRPSFLVHPLLRSDKKPPLT